LQYPVNWEKSGTLFLPHSLKTVSLQGKTAAGNSCRHSSDKHLNTNKKL
jgi:hypothetical protein